MAVSDTSGERTYYFDLLRIFATAAVMTLHIAAQNWNTADIRSAAWNVFNVFDGAVRWGVPVFTMISGALFLDREVPVGTMFRKYIFRILMAFAFWSAVYVAAYCIETGEPVSPGTAFTMFVGGHYHMWYLYMIVGLYLIVPLLRRITADERLAKYFLLLGFLFSFAIPQFIQIVSVFSPEYGDFLNSLIGMVKMHFVVGYSFYFVLGWYISRRAISTGIWRGVCVLGVLGFLVTILATVWVSQRSGVQNSLFYDNLTVNVLCESVLVFTACKRGFEHAAWKERTRRIVRALSKYSFGAYLVHALIIEILDAVFHLNTLSLRPLPAIFVILVPVFAVSFAISALLNHIPGLRKYIV